MDVIISAYDYLHESHMRVTWQFNRPIIDIRGEHPPTSPLPRHEGDRVERIDRKYQNANCVRGSVLSKIFVFLSNFVVYKQPPHPLVILRLKYC